MDRTPVHLAVLALVEDATTGDLSSANVAIERATDAGHRAVAQDLASSEAEIRAQLTRWIGQPHIDVVIVVGDDRGATRAALAPLVTEALPGFANVWAARCSSKVVFVLPPNPAAAKTAMDTTVLPKLDSRRSDSLIKLMPRLAQPRGKPRTGKNVVKRDGDDDFDPPTKPIDVEGLERQIAMSSAENPTRQVDLAKLSSMAADSSDDDDDDELALQKPKRPAFLPAKTTIAIPPATPKTANPKPAPPPPPSQPLPVTPQKVATTTPRPPVTPRSALQTPAMGAPVTSTPPAIPTSRATMQTPAMGAPVVATPPPMPRTTAPTPAPPPTPRTTSPTPGPPPSAAAKPELRATMHGVPPALPKASAQPPARPTVQTPPVGAGTIQTSSIAPPPAPPASPRSLQTPPMGAPITPPPPPAKGGTLQVSSIAPPPNRSTMQTPPMGAPIAPPPPPARATVQAAPIAPAARPPAPAPPPVQQPPPVQPPPPPTQPIARPTLQTPPIGAPVQAPPPPPQPIARPTLQTPPMGAPIVAPPPPPPVARPTLQTPPMGAPIAAPPAPPEPRRSIVPTPPMPTPVVAAPAEPAHVVLVSAADPSDRGWTQPMEPIARPMAAPMPTDPGWTQPLPVDRPAPPRTPPAGTPSISDAAPHAPPPALPRRTIATPAAGLPVARPVETHSEITDVLPVPPPPAPPTPPKRPTVATPAVGLPHATAPAEPPPPPRQPRAVGIRPEEGDPFEAAPPPSFAAPNLWDAPANADAVPRAMTPRSARADKTMVVKIPGRGPSKRVIALMLLAAACAVVAAVVVVTHHEKGTVPIDAAGAIVAKVESDAAVAIIDPTPDAAVEPDIEIDPGKHDAGVARPPIAPPHAGSATPPIAPPHTGSATPPIAPPHTGSATPVAPPVTPIEPAHPVPPGPPPEAGCDEVSCVLDRYARPCCARWKPVENGFDPKTTMPDRLDRAMVKDGVERMKPRVIACGERNPAKGTVKLSITVAPDGSVSNASVSEAPDAALGECVATVLRKASFGKTINGATFVYPFAF